MIISGNVTSVTLRVNWGSFHSIQSGSMLCGVGTVVPVVGLKPLGPCTSLVLFIGKVLNGVSSN